MSGRSRMAALGAGAVAGGGVGFGSIDGFASTILQDRRRAAAAVTRIAGAGMLIVGAVLILDRTLG